ncbi:MAG: carbohydrate ABC transporter permease [Fimbriimonas sp.]|nr:carbohydrate ABC transporter permease [Fimbriimonas sp.]
MSLIGPVGRRRPRARIAIGFLYLALCIGAITTLYPFALMISTGLKGPTDQADSRLVPAYLVDNHVLLNKYVDDKYAGDKFDIASSRTGGTASASDLERYRAFLMQLPPDRWLAGFKNAPNQVTGRLTLLYHDWLRKRYRSIDTLNRAYLEENVGFQTVNTPAELMDRADWKPALGSKWQEWIAFKQGLPAEFRVPIRSQWLWQKFLASKFKNQFTLVPQPIAGNAKTFEEIELPGESTRPLALWIEFVAHQPARFRSDPVEEQWERFIGASRAMPIGAANASDLWSRAGPIRREFATRNYGYVLDYILLNGRAVWNTIVFCLLAIMTQLTVNPLAAYALSRYPVRQSGKILIFLLATMAFPTEVAMIPSFLLLKDLGLLNTFAALVLPGAASGYMIFLLKGFFDSLPQELFEAGSIDGAPEATMMLRIAFPLSRPVFGYIALLAFMGAYGAFIYAYLVAQDQRIWTLMVWIYQLQSGGAPKAVVMAALTVAAVPTLVVFLCTQRVIMRGIVLPGER